MKDNIKKFMRSLAGVTDKNKEDMESLITFLELPTDQFKKGYPKIKKVLESMYSSSEFQQQILRNSGNTSQEEWTQANLSMKAFFEEVDTDKSLCKEKKEMIRMIFGKTIEVAEELSETGYEISEVKIKKINNKGIIPTYAHKGDAGADLYAIEEVTVGGGETKTISTGLSVALPKGYMLNIYPRSGMSLKTPLRIANSVGIIDSNYRGEIKVIFQNISSEPYTIKENDKIAQIVLTKIPKINWTEVEELDQTERGEEGFGSSDEG